MPAARTAPRALLLLLLLAAASTTTAKFCYVGVSDQRVYDTSTEAIECAPALYGDNAACAFVRPGNGASATSNSGDSSAPGPATL